MCQSISTTPGHSHANNYPHYPKAGTPLGLLLRVVNLIGAATTANETVVDHEQDEDNDPHQDGEARPDDHSLECKETHVLCIYVGKYTHVHIRTLHRMYSHMRTYVHTYICTSVQMYKYMYIHTYARS